MEDGGRRRRRRWAVLGAALAGTVLISGVGLWATDSWPLKDSYCWGAWKQDSGPRFLGEKGIALADARRASAESGTPGSDGATATCTLTVTSALSDSHSEEPTRFEDKVTLSYGPVPEAPGERRAWIDRYFNGTASPLPDGLDGLVADDRGMLILPEACDVDGRPSAVTLWAEGWGDGHLGKVAMSLSLGSESDVSTMLLDAADTGMRKAGCAPEKPLRMSSPLVRLAERTGSGAGRPICRIPGVEFPLEKGGRNSDVRVGVVGDRLQTCSVVWTKRGAPDEPAAQFVMAGSPRTAAVFAGLPEGAEHGLVRTTCDGRSTVFYAHIGTGLGDAGGKKDRRVFEAFTAAVGQRIGCEPAKGTEETEGTTEGAAG
ncbi:hypothetical protein [Streptomyces sp. NPDC059452]|uniref:hypothetical protein n=1 Tax=Streptomyces sp. NPDC059452 TaxID=3346835 RepID=UPI00369C5DFE